MDYIACQAPLSMGFSRQEYRSGWPFPSLKINHTSVKKKKKKKNNNNKVN